MEERRVEVTLIRAENLEDVNLISRMKTFAVVKISPIGLEYTTKVDDEGGVNPYWNESFAFMMPEVYLRDGTAKMKVEIWTTGTVDEKEVGQVTVPLTETAASSAGTMMSWKETRIYTIRSKAGEPHGRLHVGLAYGTGAGDAGFTVAPMVRPRPGYTLPAPTQPPYYYPPRPQTPHPEPPLYRPPTFEPPSYPPSPPPSYHPPASEPPSYPPSPPPSYYPPPSPSYPPPKPVPLPPSLSLTPQPPSRLGQIPSGTPIPVTPPPPYVGPPTSTTGLFSSPLGKMLLTDLTIKIRPLRQY